MVLIKDWSLLLEAAMLALWPKPQQMCCFCFSLANWQPSASSPKTVRERKSSAPPPLIKSTMRPIFLMSAGDRRKGTSSFRGEKPRERTDSRNETHVLTQADCCPPIRKFLPCVARSLNSWVIGALVCPTKAT